MAKDTPDSVVTPQQAETLTPDFCIIGAGPGGLAVAATAAAFGQRVVLIEKHKMGGNSLNYGSVPGKALLAAAKRAHQMRHAGAFGIMPADPQIDRQAVHDYVKDTIAAVAPNDSIERFTGLGVKVINDTARFVDKTTVIAGEYRISPRFFVIATGSSPAIPAIPGLADVPHFTNESIFDVTEPLPHLIVIGAGSVGLELAQAHRRLGSNVTVIDAAAALAKDDPELSVVAVSALRDEGIDIRENTHITSISGDGGRVNVTVTRDGATELIVGTHILVAAGRKANVADLGLEAAGIRFDNAGIKVDTGLRTANGRAFAIGDVVGGPQFTHVATEHAGIVFRRALFRIPAKTTSRPLPWVTFTDPELAHVGLTELQARARHGRVNVLRWPYGENDRAQIDRQTRGQIKVVTSKRGHILGVTIVGAAAGDIIQMWSLAIAKGLKIKALTEWVAPYPTLSEISKRAALRYFATAPSNPIVRKTIALLAKLG